MHNGTNNLEVTIDTTNELALIGKKLDLWKKYFEGLNNYLFNADGLSFLYLHTSRSWSRL